MTEEVTQPVDTDDNTPKDASHEPQAPQHAANEKKGASKASKAAEEKMLIAVVKLGHDGIKVHPTAVAAHVAAGWTVQAD